MHSIFSKTLWKFVISIHYAYVSNCFDHDQINLISIFLSTCRALLKIEGQVNHHFGKKKKITHQNIIEAAAKSGFKQQRLTFP